MKQMLDRWLITENKAKTRTEEHTEEPALPINQTILGDCLEALQTFPDNFFDSVVTDPPYGLEFMGKEWDKFEGSPLFGKRKISTPSWDFNTSYTSTFQEFCFNWAKEVLRVLKPGGYLLSFGGSRTYHRLTCGLEDAGFEIRDMIAWIYGSGFPKSLDISKAIDREKGLKRERIGTKYELLGHGKKNPENIFPHKRNWVNDPDANSHYVSLPASEEASEWDGWGTALKPSIEPICLARKPPSEKNIAQNILKWRTGGLNINAGRITLKNIEFHRTEGKSALGKRIYGDYENKSKELTDLPRYNEQGRFPANTILDPQTAQQLDKQSGEREGCKPHKIKSNILNFEGWGSITQKQGEVIGYNDFGGASRFFYIAKAGRGERFGYCQACEKVIPQENWETRKNPQTGKPAITCPNCKTQESAVFHVTVKPLDLMKYLVRLVTPKGGVCLDPFIGSGTTGIACLTQGYKFIGIEIDPIYHKIAQHRLKPYLEQEKLEAFVK